METRLQGDVTSLLGRSDFTSDSLVQAAHLLGDNPIFIVEWHTRRVLACNDAVRRVFGYEPADLWNDTTRRLHVSDDAFEAFGVESERHILDGATSFQCRYRMRRRDGTDFPSENLVQVVHDSEQGPLAVISVVRDLTEIPLSGEEERAAAGLQVERLAHDVPGAVFERVHGSDGIDRYTYIAGRLLDEHGVDAAAARRDPRTVFDLIEAHDRAVFERVLASSRVSLSGIDMVLRFHPPDGETVWLRVISRPSRAEGGATVWNGMAIDVTREKLAEDQAHWLATHDSLTGLVNRYQFVGHLERSVDSARTHGRHLAVAQVGVRGMLRINESYGFGAGDEVLRQFAARLQAAVPASGVVSRSHGDIFLVLLEVAQRRGDMEDTIRALRGACAEAFVTADGTAVRTEMTIGVACFPADGDSADELLRAAALAAERAHQRPDLAYDFYAQDLSARIRDRFRTENELREAIARDELEPHFQPQLALADGALVGFEALVRWQRPDGQWVSPADFIPLAEETGLIAALGELMLRRVAARVHDWTRRGYAVPPIAVNCSAHQFRAHDFVDTYRRAVIAPGVDPRTVALEITESTLVEDFEATERTMLALAEWGVHFAIDDFGTGFSSLGYLTRLPFHALKVDRSFVWAVPTDPRQHSIVKALVQMADALELYVIAEGIETAEQEAEMRRLGCHAVQGFRWSAPLPPDEARAWLQPCT